MSTNYENPTRVTLLYSDAGTHREPSGCNVYTLADGRYEVERTNAGASTGGYLTRDSKDASKSYDGPGRLLTLNRPVKGSRFPAAANR